MIEIKELEKKEENWELLLEPWYSFHDGSPTHSTMTGLKTPEGRSLLKLCLQDMVITADCPVVIAWDTEQNKVAGMSFHQIDRRDRDSTIPYHDLPGTFKYGKYTWPEETQAAWAVEVDFYLNHLIVPLNFFERYKVDSCWNFCLLSVLPEYGGQGVGELITKRSMQVAKDLGVPMSRANFASTFSQKIGLKCGFEPVIEAGYQERYKHFDKMSAEVKKLHTKCVAMTKVL